MSLFSGFDAVNVNRLGQFVQLEFPAGATAEELENSELRVWLSRINSEEHPERPIRWVTTEELLDLIPDESALDPPRRRRFGKVLPRNVNARPDFHRALLLLAEVHGLARETLTAAALNQGLSRLALLRLQELIQEHARLAFGVSDPNLDRVVPLDQCSLDPIPREKLRAMDAGENQALQDMAWLLLELRAAIAVNEPGGPGGAALCEECGSPFVAARRGQQFCSHRCADTNGARVRRALKLGKEPPPRRRTVLSDCQNPIESDTLTAAI